jgi:hypothetical protein
MGMKLAHLLAGSAICRLFLSGIPLVEASANGDGPRLEEIGRNVPKKLREVIETPVEYDTERRQPTIEALKKELDKATPAVSFSIRGDLILTSTTGDWTISTIPWKGPSVVEVRQKKRPKGALGAEGLTKSQGQNQGRGPHRSVCLLKMNVVGLPPSAASSVAVRLPLGATAVGEPRPCGICPTLAR